MNKLEAQIVVENTGNYDEEELWEEVNRVQEILGTETMLHNLKKAMGDDMLENLTAYICRTHDIETTCKEEK